MKKHENPMTMGELLQNMEADAEEYGDLHNEDCPAVTSLEDACDCYNVTAAKQIAREAMQEVNNWWVRMAKAEKGGKPLNAAEGKHFAAKMLGKNRKP